MITLVKPDHSWSTMPGWGIAVDLTPPELIASRQLKVLRKLIGAGLAALLLLCAGGYAVVFVQHGSAQNELAAEQARTPGLQSQQSKYSDVTQLQATLTLLQGQVTTLMVGDVDFDALLVTLRGALPATMTIDTASVTIATGATASSGAGPTGLDTSGRKAIGTVVIGGSAPAYDDIAVYVDRLSAIKGIVNVVPTSAQTDTSKIGVQYNLTLGLTDLRLSHRFDAAKNGSK